MPAASRAADRLQSPQRAQARCRASPHGPSPFAPAARRPSGQSAGNPHREGAPVARGNRAPRPRRRRAPDRRRTRRDQPRRHERLEAAGTGRTVLGHRRAAVARAGEGIRARVASAVRAGAGGGEGGADPRERTCDRVQAPARQRGGQAHRAGRPTAHGGPRASLPPVHGARSGQQLPVLRPRAGSHVARRARDLRVRPRSQHPPHSGRAGPAGGHTRAAHDPVAAAGARQSLRLPAGPAPRRAALRAGVRPLGEAHRRRPGAPDGQGRRDRARRARFPAVFGEQGRLDRGQQAVPAHVRPGIPDPGADPCAGSRRRNARGRRPRRRGAPPVPLAAEAAAAAVGHSAGAPVQPPAVARARRHVLGARGRLAVQPRRARGRVAAAQWPAADGQLPGDQSHAGRIRAAPDRLRADGAAHRRSRRAAHRGTQQPAGRARALVSQHVQGQRPRVRLRIAVRQSGSRGGRRRGRAARVAASGRRAAGRHTGRPRRRARRRCWCRPVRSSWNRRSR